MKIRAAIAFAVFAAVACAADQDDYCDNVGDCAEGGSSDFIQSCKEDARFLKREASSNGCSGKFDDYFACTQSNFECHGATAVFPGCDAQRAALDDCFAAAQAKTSCAELAT